RSRWWPARGWPPWRGHRARRSTAWTHARGVTGGPARLPRRPRSGADTGDREHLDVTDVPARGGHDRHDVAGRRVEGDLDLPPGALAAGGDAAVRGERLGGRRLAEL